MQIVYILIIPSVLLKTIMVMIISNVSIGAFDAYGFII